MKVSSERQGRGQGPRAGRMLTLGTDSSALRNGRNAGSPPFLLTRCPPTARRMCCPLLRTGLATRRPQSLLPQGRKLLWSVPERVGMGWRLPSPGWGMTFVFWAAAAGPQVLERVNLSIP